MAEHTGLIASVVTLHILVRRIVENRRWHRADRRPWHEPTTHDRVADLLKQVSDEQIGVEAPKEGNTPLGGHARFVIVAVSRAGREVPIRATHGVLSMEDEIARDLAVAVVQRRACERRQIAPEAIDTRSTGHSIAGDSLLAFQIAVLLPVLRKSVL